MNAHEEFFARPAVTTALDELAQKCFEQIEGQGSPGELPSGEEFLRTAGVDGGEGGSLTIAHTVSAPEVQPSAPTVPCNGESRCIPRCKIIKGQQHCVWVCRCP
jgi:hypothetical protein